MSHYWHLHCPRCKDGCDVDVNHGDDLLVKAVEESYPLWLLSKTGWNVSSVEYQCRTGLASFIIQHWECGGFEVRGEYSFDVPIPCRPNTPDYWTLILPGLAERAKEDVERLRGIVAEIEGAMRKVGGASDDTRANP